MYGPASSDQILDTYSGIGYYCMQIIKADTCVHSTNVSGT